MLDFSIYCNMVFLTGAGVSAASGLGTYRGPGGLWEADIARIADARNLPGSLPDLWRLYGARRKRARQAGPNAAHRALAAFEQRWDGKDGRRRVTVITQNVDGLHGRAGSKNVVEMHGSAFRTRCTNKGCVLPPFADQAIYDAVPVCSRCGAPLRPDVVLFGEAIPERVIGAIENALAGVDLFVAVGTSGVVYPAANLVSGAARAGARTVLVNLEPMLVPHAAFQEEYLGPAETLLPELLSVPLDNAN